MQRCRVRTFGESVGLLARFVNRMTDAAATARRHGDLEIPGRNRELILPSFPNLLYAFPGERKWKYIFFGDPIFHTQDYMAIDQRARYAFEAIGTSKSMVVAVPGQGSQYAGVYQDSSGEWLTGEHTYRIHLPRNVPVNMFWSLTTYDNETRAMIQNELGRPLVGSVHGAKANDDGSFDCYFGPELPDGAPEENWV